MSSTENVQEPKLPSFIVGMGKDANMEGEKRFNQGMWRFWLAENKEANIIFLSRGDDTPVIWEHQVGLWKKGKKDWNNFFTCSMDSVGSCPLCQYSDEHDNFWRQKVQIYTILHLKEWVDKKGKKHPFTKMLLAAKKDVAAILVRKYATRLDESGTLRGGQFKVFRAPGSKSNTGSDFEFVKVIDLAKLAGEDQDLIKPLDYMTLAPNRELMARIVDRLRGGKQDNTEGDNVDDVVTDLPSAAVDYGDNIDTLAQSVE